MSHDPFFDTDVPERSEKPPVEEQEAFSVDQKIGLIFLDIANKLLKNGKEKPKVELEDGLGLFKDSNRYK